VIREDIARGMVRRWLDHDGSKGFLRDRKHPIGLFALDLGRVGEPALEEWKRAKPPPPATLPAELLGVGGPPGPVPPPPRPPVALERHERVTASTKRPPAELPQGPDVLAKLAVGAANLLAALESEPSARRAAETRATARPAQRAKDTQAGAPKGGAEGGRVEAERPAAPPSVPEAPKIPPPTALAEGSIPEEQAPAVGPPPDGGPESAPEAGRPRRYGTRTRVSLPRAALAASWASSGRSGAEEVPASQDAPALEGAGRARGREPPK
jgi:hypothetical protein